MANEFQKIEELVKKHPAISIGIAGLGVLLYIKSKGGAAGAAGAVSSLVPGIPSGGVADPNSLGNFANPAAASYQGAAAGSGSLGTTSANTIINPSYIAATATNPFGSLAYTDAYGNSSGIDLTARGLSDVQAGTNPLQDAYPTPVSNVVASPSAPNSAYAAKNTSLIGGAIQNLQGCHGILDCIGSAFTTVLAGGASAISTGLIPGVPAAAVAGLGYITGIPNLNPKIAQNNAANVAKPGQLSSVAANAGGSYVPGVNFPAGSATATYQAAGTNPTGLNTHIAAPSISTSGNILTRAFRR